MATLVLSVVSAPSLHAEQHKTPPLPARAKTSASSDLAAASSSEQKRLTFVVFGDAFGASVARGMTDAFRADPSIAVDDRTADDNELTRVDAAAWDRAIDAARRDDRPVAAAVVMLGADEDGPLVDAKGVAHAPGTPEWRGLYGDRVERVAVAFRERRLPVIWVGLPNVRSGEDAKTYADLNAVFRDRSVKGGATFVDVWEPFSDEAGRFALEGPDINGQDAVLRRSDGWGFTRAGARVLASFLDGGLKRARDQAASATRLAALSAANPEAFDQALQIDVNAQIRREAGLPVDPSPAPEKAIRPAIDLMAPPLAKDGALASIKVMADGPQDRPRLGNSPPHPGRTDDFSLPARR